MKHIHLDLIDRDSAVYRQGQQDARKGQSCRTDEDVFGGYYLDYLAGYREAVSARDRAGR